ncbi:MAG: hypothetical protein A2V66_16540 [Ignavibacteria bacterium RBG_13_36_8]|nr:MAG: hypothetical protein A2V66_16540 [Ignavibacteria bacterium RBG_13_36_8]
MIWHLIESGYNTGRYNMDYDICLTKNTLPDHAFFRLYQWKPYCISLGKNQSVNDINIEKAKKDDIDIVIRPTGGRAILHAEEITYSIVIPYSKNLSAQKIYNKVSLALIKGLVNYHPLLKETELEKVQPDFPSLLKQPSGVMCFASTAKNEVKYMGKKLIGSAQRKMERIILQHGSILCGKYHQNITSYLNYNDENINDLRYELRNKTIEIETIINEKVDYDRLSQCLIEGFKDEWQIEFSKNPITMSLVK